MNVSAFALLCLDLAQRVEVTFIQVDDPFSLEGESLLHNNSLDAAPGKNDALAQENEEYQARSPSPGSTIEPDFTISRASSFLQHEIELDTDQGSSGPRPRRFLESALVGNSPGWRTPATNVTVDTPASVGVPVSRAESSRRNTDPKVIVSHMIRHFKEGPGQW